MTSDEARELFSAAYDGELSADQQRAFDQAVAEDEELRSEYEEFRDMLNEAHAFGADGDEGEVPDLLAGVQTKLRSRSRGRFYRDRFAENSGSRTMLPLLLGMAMLVVLVIAWVLMHFIQVEVPEPQGEPRESHQATES